MPEQKGFVFNTPDGDVDVTIEEVKQLAAKDDPDGLYALGMAYLFGWDIEQNEGLGYGYLEKASDKGQTEAMTLLVRMFMQGEYTGIDSDRAAEMSIEAAKDGIADAQLYAGLAYMDGVHVPQDYTKASEYFRSSANQGNHEARTNLAYLYQEGLGVPKDEGKAFKLYRTAAKGGNVNAMFHLGICYEFGVGTRMSLPDAVVQYRDGASNGDAFAMERLGYLLSEGFDGQEPDAEGSFEWFLKAAMEGVPTAMYMVGYYYANGIGTETDVSESKKWLKMAADNDIDEAKELLSSMS